MKPTIKDIAAELNLSYSSVSRALTGNKGVSDKTRKMVQAVAERLGYSPNEVARSLVNKHSSTIGVVLPDIQNAYFSEVLQGIIEAASGNDFTVIFCISNWDADKEQKYIQNLQSRRVSGLIFKSVSGDKAYTTKDIHVPAVEIEPRVKKSVFSHIESDDVSGGTMATSYLIDCGYKNIAFLAGRMSSRSCNMRRVGYEQIIEKHGLKKHIKYGDFTMESGYNLAKCMLSSDPTIDAFFTVNDIVALGAIQYLDDIKKRIPEDFGLIGFDNISYTNMSRISLTTVDQPSKILGKNSFELLLNAINGEPVQRLIYQPQLVVRKTTREPK